MWRLAVLIGLGAALAACQRVPSTALGDAGRGAFVIGQAQCGSCHVIPGIADADGMSGPPLGGFARRAMIAGVSANTPEGLVTWLRTPQTVAPANAMPQMELSEQQAKDVAAYLETLQ